MQFMLLTIGAVPLYESLNIPRDTVGKHPTCNVNKGQVPHCRKWAVYPLIGVYLFTSGTHAILYVLRYYTMYKIQSEIEILREWSIRIFSILCHQIQKIPGCWGWRKLQLPPSPRFHISAKPTSIAGVTDRLTIDTSQHWGKGLSVCPTTHTHAHTHTEAGKHRDEALWGYSHTLRSGGLEAATFQLPASENGSSCAEGR